MYVNIVKKQKFQPPTPLKWIGGWNFKRDYNEKKKKGDVVVNCSRQGLKSVLHLSKPQSRLALTAGMIMR